MLVELGESEACGSQSPVPAELAGQDCQRPVRGRFRLGCIPEPVTDDRAQRVEPCRSVERDPRWPDHVRLGFAQHVLGEAEGPQGGLPVAPVRVPDRCPGVSERGEQRVAASDARCLSRTAGIQGLAVLLPLVGEHRQ
ncbi:hypothetical protein ACFYRC_36990 [Streptomyces sp. NPDC005279]|uniref:hypothetical protein n=1 Tax=Streptomyces sp. NPDC005279 TaxID=3364712 RepID=UPI0036897D15